jgi:predicted amidohydrolase
MKKTPGRIKRAIRRKTEALTAPLKALSATCPAYKPGGVAYWRAALQARAMVTGAPVTAVTATGYAGYREETTFLPSGREVIKDFGGLGPL